MDHAPQPGGERLVGHREGVGDERDEEGHEAHQEGQGAGRRLDLFCCVEIYKKRNVIQIWWSIFVLRGLNIHLEHGFFVLHEWEGV